MTKTKSTFLTLIAVLLSPVAANADLITGTISGWEESRGWRHFGDGTNIVSIGWSILNYNRGHFYNTNGSVVAMANGVEDISDITDASIFVPASYSLAACDADCAGNGVGHFLVLRNTSTSFFGALRIDDIIGHRGGTLNATWWFQTDGTGNFASVPEPGTLALLGIGLFGMGLSRRRREV